MIAPAVVKAGNGWPLDAHLEATEIEPFVEWLRLDRELGGQGMDRGRARQTASPLRAMLKERSADELARIRNDELHLHVKYVNRTAATRKMGHAAHRLFLLYRGIA
jgi:hypothetical protein